MRAVFIVVGSFNHSIVYGSIHFDKSSALPSKQRGGTALCRTRVYMHADDIWPLYMDAYRMHRRDEEANKNREERSTATIIR